MYPDSKSDGWVSEAEPITIVEGGRESEEGRDGG